jgi:hypothetical protein
MHYAPAEVFSLRCPTHLFDSFFRGSAGGGQVQDFAFNYSEKVNEILRDERITGDPAMAARIN